MNELFFGHPIILWYVSSLNYHKDLISNLELLNQINNIEDFALYLMGHPDINGITIVASSMISVKETYNRLDSLIKDKFISLDLEGSLMLDFPLSEDINYSQLRFCFYFEEYISDFENILEKLRIIKTTNAENKRANIVLVLYFNENSFIKLNKDSLEKVYNFTKEIGIKLNIIPIPKNFLKDEFAISKKNYIKLTSFASKLKFLKEEIYFDMPVYGINDSRFEWICPAKIWSLFFSSWKLVNCRFLWSQHYYEFGELSEIDDNWKQNVSRYSWLSDKCSKCTAKNWCFGGCIWNQEYNEADYYCLK